MRRIAVIALLWIAVPLAHSQQPSKPARPAAPQSAAAAADEAQTRQDLQRMKSLVEQMQRNLASVSTAQDPLKHQFELEIEMWQIEIARTERRLNSSAEKE